MANKRYMRGVNFEYERIEYHRKNGAITAFRTAGSHSPFDVVAIYDGRVYFEQLKRTKKKHISRDTAEYKKAISEIKDIHLPDGCICRFLVRLEGLKQPIILYEG